jgi:hypothetical protein
MGLASIGSGRPISGRLVLVLCRTRVSEEWGCNAACRCASASTPLALRRLEPLMPSEVALIPECAECGDVWLPADRDRWRLRLDVDDELVWCCPECDWREFGSDD